MDKTKNLLFPEWNHFCNLLQLFMFTGLKVLEITYNTYIVAAPQNQ